MIKDYSKITDRIYMQLSPELSQEFHSMLVDMAVAFSRLYEIDNAKPSEAMKCLKFLKDETINDIACLKNSVTTKTLYQLYFANFDSIEQALNKAQEIENKKYLKWEDLETYNENLRIDLKVSLNETEYRLSYFKNDTLKLLTNDKDFYLEIENKQFFNDLHLELLDNE